jgi:predicted nucleic acid-binding protein
MTSFLLDACAFIALILAENGAMMVKDLLDRAESGEIFVSICAINLLEVYYGVIKNSGVEYADMVLDSIKNSSISVINPLEYEDVFKEAGRIKANYRLSLADATALAYASVMNCTLVTSDHHEMDIVESNEKIKFLWVR